MQNKKKYLFNEAERLYIYEYMTINELADRLNVNRKTIMAWKESGDWDSKRRVYLKSKQTFHEEMYEFDDPGQLKDYMEVNTFSVSCIGVYQIM